MTLVSRRWHLSGDSEVIWSMMKTEIRADGSLEKGSLVLFPDKFFPAFRGKISSSYVVKQLSNWMRQLMEPWAVIRSSILNTA